jgi:type II secretory pathway pseudopilin PulG
VVITVVAILIVVAVVNVRSSEIDARDAERKTDMQNFALALESYRAQNGTYPGTSLLAGQPSAITTALPDFDLNNLRTPNNNNTPSVNSSAATVNTEAISPGDAYVYQPLDAAGSLCATGTISQPCTRFNLYYALERDGSVQIIRSRRT